MYENAGKLTDVFVEEITGYNYKTKMNKFLWLNVWADEGLKDIIAKVPGVAEVYTELPIKYTVYLDPRYNQYWVMHEIEIQIKRNQLMRNE